MSTRPPIRPSAETPSTPLTAEKAGTTHPTQPRLSACERSYPTSHVWLPSRAVQCSAVPDCAHPHPSPFPSPSSPPATHGSPASPPHGHPAQPSTAQSPLNDLEFDLELALRPRHLPSCRHGRSGTAIVARAAAQRQRVRQPAGGAGLLQDGVRDAGGRAAGVPVVQQGARGGAGARRGGEREARAQAAGEGRARRLRGGGVEGA